MHVRTRARRTKRRYLAAAVAALGTLTVLVGPVSAAPTPPVPVITANAPAQATTVSAATITATLTSVGAGETVYLDRLSGSTTVVQATTPASATGTASFSVTQATPSLYAYRVRVTATGAHQASTSPWVLVNVVLPTPDITLALPDQAAAGSPASIGVTTDQAPVGDEIVVLQQQTGDTWTAVASATTADDGSATLTVTPPRAGTVTYRAQLSPTTLHKAGTSTTYTLDVGAPGTATPADPTTSDECGGTDPVKADGSPWVCTYDDEFDGTSLDRRYWVPQVSASSGYYSGTASSPACVIDDPQTIAVGDGNLQLNAKVLDAPLTCGSARTREVSGMVTQYGTFSQTFGKYEIRAKLPAWTGKGLQETFWLWPNDVLRYGTSWPASGEIDLAEFYSVLSSLDVPVFHYLFDPKSVNLLTGANVFTAQNCTINVGAFNTYGLEWSPGRLKVLINDKVCVVDNYTATNAPAANPYAPFDSPFFLALTQAFGAAGNEFDLATGPRLSTTLVDYVRVWS